MHSNAAAAAAFAASETRNCKHFSQRHRIYAPGAFEQQTPVFEKQKLHQFGRVLCFLYDVFADTFEKTH